MNFKEKLVHPYTLIFCVCLVSRLLFKFISGYDNFELFWDSTRYDMLSERIIDGNFDLDVVAYLIAPAYPYFLAICKTISYENWEMIAVAIQFVLTSFSAVYIYKITLLIFQKTSQAIIAALIYVMYPLTMWLNFTIVQETLFQCLFVYFIYHFLAYNRWLQFYQLVLASLFFTLALLCKSHILILLPFVLFLLLYKCNWKSAIYFLVILILLIIPNGLINKKLHNIYTISSFGNGSFFLLGHSQYTYDCLLNPSGNKGAFSLDGCDPSCVFDTTFEFESFGKINTLPHKERNAKKFEAGFEWIKNNPVKFLNLKIHGITRFILPGLDYKIYNFNYWLLSLIAGLLIYIPGLFYAIKNIKKGEVDLLLLLSIYITCGAIFILFFPVNRFRVITLEPFLIVYASCFYAHIYNKIKNRWLSYRQPSA